MRNFLFKLFEDHAVLETLEATGKFRTLAFCQWLIGVN